MKYPKLKEYIFPVDKDIYFRTKFKKVIRVPAKVGTAFYKKADVRKYLREQQKVLK